MSKYDNLDFKSEPDNGEKYDKSNLFYVKSMLKKKGDTSYTFKKNKQNFGRVYSDFGLQGLSSEIRNFICHEKCSDIDIVNCHPVLLEQIFHKNGLICPNLTEYVNNRPSILKKHNVDKQHIMYVINNFNYSSENNFFQTINDQIYKELIPKLIQQNQEMFDFSSKKNSQNPNGTFISYYLQTIENNILFQLKDIFESNGYSINALIFDGFLVNDTNITQEILDLYSSQVKDWKFKLIKKEMKFDNLLKFLNDNEPIDLSLILKYEDHKIEFEKTHFKCIDDGLVYEINKNIIKSFSKTQMKDKYGHIDCLNGNELEKFIHHWLEDNDMRTYKFVGSFFSNDDCPNDTFNLFLGFDVDFIETFEPNEQQEQDLQFILDHFKFLCNNDEVVYDYVIRWYAHMFKHPSTKNNISLFFKSKQGAGKNLSTDFIAKLIGFENCSVIDDIERDVFGHFNPLLKNKLLVVIDEMQAKNGFKYSDRIKSLISGLTININEKNVGKQVIQNNAHFVFYSNNDLCIQLEDSDRRFLTIECILPIPDKQYFDKFIKIMNDKSIQRLFYDHLLSIDTNIDWINDRPITQLSKELKANTKEPYELFLLNHINSIDTDDIRDYSSSDLLSMYNEYANENSLRFNYNSVSLGIKLSKTKLNFIEKKSNIKGHSRYYIDYSKAKEYLNKTGLSNFL